ncbi:MAG: NADase-type glycan-binding domain-containing protein [Acidobacteriota bacterium]
MRRLAWISIVAATTASAAPPVQDVEAPATLAVSVSATSTLATRGKTYEPWYALGGDPTRIWCEGKVDEGIGEALVVKLAVPTRIESVTIRAGVWRSPELFRANNRITELEISSDDGRTKKVSLREEREDVEVELWRDQVKELRFQIAAVAKGKVNDTCISGLDLHASGRSQIVLVADAAAAPPLAPACPQAFRAIAGCAEPALRAQLKFPFAYRRVDTRSRRFADARAARKACTAGSFRAFVDAGAPTRAVSPAPGKVTLTSDVFDWQLVLAGASWRLATLEDNTP